MPLSLELIKERKSKLPFLDTVFSEQWPLHFKLNLPCCESFHSLWLPFTVYNLCKKSMSSQCCRQGHKGRKDPKYLRCQIMPSISNRVAHKEASYTLEVE